MSHNEEDKLPQPSPGERGKRLWERRRQEFLEKVQSAERAYALWDWEPPWERRGAGQEEE